MAVLLVITIVSAAGSSAHVHIDHGSDALEGAANWRRMICMTLFPGCSAFLLRHVRGSVGPRSALLSSTSRIPT